MHILWACSWYPSVDDPFNGSFFAEQIAMLRNGGHQVQMLCVDPIWRGNKTQKSTAINEQPDVYHPKQKIFRGSFKPIIGGFLPGEKQALKKLLLPWAKTYQKKFGVPDVIHAHSVFPGILVAQILARHWGCKYGLTEHRPSTLQADSWRPRTKTITNAVRQSNFRLSVSEAMNQRLTEKYRCAPFELNYLPVTRKFFEAELPKADSEIKLLHVSHLDENKRPQMTLRAFAKARLSAPHLTLGIAGGTKKRVEELKAYADSLGVGECTTFYGQVHRPDLPQLYARHHALVLASDVEAGGTVISEALSCGIPAICTRTYAGASAVNSDLGYLVPVGDEAALSAAMTDFAKRHDYWLGQAGQIRQTARCRYSAEAFCDHLTKIYSR